MNFTNILLSHITIFLSDHLQAASTNHTTVLHLLHQMERSPFHIAWNRDRGESLTKTTR